MLAVSDRLRRRVWELRATGERLYQIARRANLHPTLLSHLLNGSKPVQPNDPRVLKLAAAVGVRPEDAIEDLENVAVGA